MKNAKQKRLRLWREDPRCHWCGRETILAPTDAKGKILLPPQKKKLAATLDHLRARHHPERHAPCGPNERRIVLACTECNSRRDVHDMRQHWAEEVIRDTGRGKPDPLRLARARAYLARCFFESPSRELNSAPSAPKADVAPRDSTAEAQKIA